MKKSFAFTLTELLLAMAIIGTITAMTIPNVINNYQRDAYLTKLRKVVNDFTNTVDMLITEEGKQNLLQTSIFTDSTNGLHNFIAHKFKVIKVCDAKASGCFASEKYKSISGSSSSYECDSKSYVLADSAVICVAKNTSDISVQVDTNGEEGPNIGGRDMFSFKIDSSGNVATSSDTCNSSATGDGCLKDILEANWKMNY